MASRAMSVSIDKRELAGFFYVENIAALVGSAFGAGAVGQLALVAAWALGSAGRGERSRARGDWRCGALEWRRFGLGIADSFRVRKSAGCSCPGTRAGRADLLAYVIYPAGESESAAQRGSAGAGSQAQPGVQVVAAARAKSFAVSLAERSAREGTKAPAPEAHPQAKDCLF